MTAVGQRVEEPGDLADRHRAQLDQGLAADRDGPRAGIEPGALAIGAGHAPHERLELAADRAAGGAAILGQQLVGDADPFLGVRPDLAPVLPAVDDHPVAGAVEPGAAPFLIEVAPWALEHRPLGGAVGVGLEVGRDALEEMPAPPPDLLDRPQRCDRPVPDRQRRVGDQQIGGEVVADAQAVAGQAHPLRAVEAEELRAGRVEADPAGGAGVVRREQARSGRPSAAMITVPSPSLSACSTASANRPRWVELRFGRGLEPVDDRPRSGA